MYPLMVPELIGQSVEDVWVVQDVRIRQKRRQGVEQERGKSGADAMDLQLFGYERHRQAEGHLRT